MYVSTYTAINATNTNKYVFAVMLRGENEIKNVITEKILNIACGGTVEHSTVHEVTASK